MQKRIVWTFHDCLKEQPKIVNSNCKPHAVQDSPDPTTNHSGGEVLKPRIDMSVTSEFLTVTGSDSSAKTDSEGDLFSYEGDASR